MQLKEACPPHKLGDLEALVKTLKGDEAKIRQTIAEWWDTEGTSTIAADEEWNDVSKNRSAKSKPLRTGPGRGGRGRGGGRGDRKQRNFEKKKQSSPKSAATTTAPTLAVEPTPEPTLSNAEESPVVPQPSPSPAVPTPSPPEPNPQVGKGASTTPQRNVWTTKGSAHLIRAEKPVVVAEPKPDPPKPSVVEEPKPDPTKMELAPAVVAPPPAPIVEEPTEPVAVVSKAIEAPPPVAWEEPSRKPTVSVNMGRWEMNDTADQEFEFGSFQEDFPEETPAAVEPARPPPGLSMPPMPSNAVLVHELENKLDQVTIGGDPSSQPVVPPPHSEMVSPYPNTTTRNAPAPYGTAYTTNGYGNANTTNNTTTPTGFAAAKQPYNGATASPGSAPSEVLSVPPQNHYGGPMYYQHHQMHMAGQHQPPYNFTGYTQLGYAFPPNYNYSSGAAAGGQDDSKSNHRNRNNTQNYQQYAPATAYMSGHGYDPRYEGYVPPQQQQQPQGSQQQQHSSYTFDNDYSKKNKGRNNTLHSQFHGGPPTFLQQHQEHPQHLQQQQHQPEWNTTGWNTNTWQSGGGK